MLVAFAKDFGNEIEIFTENFSCFVMVTAVANQVWDGSADWILLIP